MSGPCAAIAESLAAAAVERDAAAAARAERERALAEVRTVTGRLAALLEKLVDAVHRDEVLRAQSRARLEALTAKVLDDHGLAADDLADEYGPHVPVPASAAEMAEYEAARERGEDVVAPPPMPYDRATQQRRAARAEKDLGLLGRVNPLALEEFAALEERYRFLSTQLEDLKNTRRDLLTVVREVDDKILAVFTEAYTDVAREFETVFATLFPGRRRPAGPHRPVGHAHHRHRGRGPPTGQEGQAAVAAVGRRAVAHGHGAARRDLPGPPVAVLRARRDRGRAGRRQPAPADPADGGAARRRRS